LPVDVVESASKEIGRADGLPVETADSEAKKLDRSEDTPVTTTKPASEEGVPPDELPMETSRLEPLKLNRSESFPAATIDGACEQTGLGEQRDTSERSPGEVIQESHQDILDSTSASAKYQVRERDVAGPSIEAHPKTRLESGTNYRSKLMRLVMPMRRTPA
jgi:hypothetical protein